MLSLIILAAGLSTRFGRNKLLEKVEEMPLIRKVVLAALGSKVDEVIMVLGHQDQLVRKALDGLPCRFVLNEHYLEGQSSSVKAGLRALLQRAEAVLILPGDVALITYNVIDSVIEDYFKHRGKITLASHEGRAGHPVLFDRSLFPEIMRIDEASEGLRAVVKGNQDKLRLVEVGSASVLYDFDTKEEFRKHLPSWRNEHGEEED